jgi:hypothetical protein
MTPADVRVAAVRLVERTATERGPPATITDPAALARMAAFLVPAASNHKVGVVDASAGRVSPDRPASPHHRRRGAGSGSEAA